MYCILNEQIALRSWTDIPCAFYKRGERTAIQLPVEDFLRLLLADGMHEMPKDEIQQKLLSEGYMTACEKGSKKLTDWQQYRAYENVYLPAINLEITAKCNYNCRHCFNAVDNKALKAELSFEQIGLILDQANACGVNTFLLTGGEPMMHKDFIRIVDAIYSRDMSVFEINTNGSFISDRTLDHLMKLEPKPLFKISFDGLSYHDWMRGVQGAEEKTLQAIRNTIRHGFKVMVQYNINKKNLDTVVQTLDFLDRIGVFKTRLIRTSEAPRWRESSLDQTIKEKDFFDTVLDILQGYIKNEHHMNIEAWQFLELKPSEKTISFGPVIKSADGCLRDSTYACKQTRYMMSIGANGNVYPCMQASGALEAKGIEFGNIWKSSIVDLLSGGRYIDCICMKAKDIIAKNKQCTECHFQGYCGGGCPILSLVSGDNTWEGYDPLRCFFYHNRYDQITQEKLKGFKIITPIRE